MPTVLLVEDNPSNVAMVEDIFTYDRVPARLVTVANGEEALNLAASLQPNLILMDIRLPGIDGIETTEMLKKNPQTKDIPIWAITAYAMPGDSENVIQAGCDEYHAKPLSRRIFSDHLRHFLEEQDKNKNKRP